MYNSILLPIDLGQASSWEKAMPVAFDLARKESGTVHILTVIPDFGMAVVGSFFPPDHAKELKAAFKNDLAVFINEHVPDGVDVTSTVRQGTIYKEIVTEADRLNCDVIVMASHRPETKDYLLGPNAARVVRHAKGSVFVVRD